MTNWKADWSLCCSTEVWTNQQMMECCVLQNNDLYNFRGIGLDFDHMITKIVVGQKIWFCVVYDVSNLSLFK